MINDISKSINAYFKAFKIIKELKLWNYFLIPAVIGFVLGVAFIFGAYTFSDNLGSYLADLWRWDFGKSFITSLSTWLGGFFIIIIGIILYKHLLMALSSPFMTPVSEKVEVYLTGKPIVVNKEGRSAMKQLMRSLNLNLTLLVKELLVTFTLFILSLIPLIGLVATFLIFYKQSYYAGFGNMDYTLERYLNYSESKKFVKKHKGIAVGNGAVFTVMLFIPIVGIMLTLPISTVAATINTVEKLELESRI